jgi:hypothetical protein
MDPSRRNPFELAIEARTIRLGRAVNRDFLNSYFREAGFNYSPCQMASVTYLAWHETVLKSGLTFPEYLAEMAFPADCEMDKAIEAQFAAYRADKAEQERAYREQMKRKREIETMVTAALGVGGVATLAVLGGILYRRHRLAVAEAAAAEEEDPRGPGYQ